MAVYERRYRRYDGEFVPTSRTTWAIPRYAFADVFRMRLFTAFFVLAFVPPLLALTIIYFKSRPEDIGQLGPLLEALAIDRAAFRSFLTVQSVFAFVVAIVVGPSMLYKDLVGGGLPLLLARPITRWGYILAKLSVPVLLLSAITWVPGLLLFIVQSVLVGEGWMGRNVGIGLAIFAASWAWIALLSLLSVAVAASVKSRIWSRAVFFAIFFVSAGVGQTINGIFSTRWGTLLDIPACIATLFQTLFGDTPTTGLTPATATASLLVFCGLCVFWMHRRVRPLEVSR